MLAAVAAAAAAGPIDREALVTRHRVVLTNMTPALTMQVGNGEIAFGVDATGLQTFHGLTMSHWGWHSVPPPGGQGPDDLKLEPWDTHGRPVGYPTSSKAQPELYAWLRENPHRLNLGRLALRLDRPLAPADVTSIRQELDPWRGIVTSRYELDGRPVRVETCAHPERDAVGVRIHSPLVAEGRLSVELAFPYGHHAAAGGVWDRPAAHRTTMTPRGARAADFDRRLDGDAYAVRLAWEGAGAVRETAPHTFVLAPGAGATSLVFSCEYAQRPPSADLPDLGRFFAAASEHWKKFWMSGGAIDLSGSRDPRWRELERRIVLSQYLLAVQEAGSLPPQESGLFNNGWNGKFHLEMHWWHGAHYALWDRWPMFERSLGWYERIRPAARQAAARQGYRGARWPKMVGPEGRDSPSGVGPLLIWQQPHPIFYAELDHRRAPGRATLDRWRDIVFDSAEFMASYAWSNPATGRFDLGPPLKTVPENTDAKTAFNPAFELSYWRFGLRVAQQWRGRLGLPREPGWDRVLAGLAPLPEADGVYLQQGGMTDTYTKWNWEHPGLVGPLGLLPGDGVDAAGMGRTVRKVWDSWQWDRKTWGWDFPLMAMAAARNGMPAMAVDALLHPAARNRMNALGLSEGGPYPYFPSNGGLLYAVAMMAAGWDPVPSHGSAGAGGAPDRPAPGFPGDGSWTVAWEGLRPAL
jgi:hypothetical protein